ncbi:MAG: hypothetical protein RSE41_00385 [Clostridia bacterium]
MIFLSTTLYNVLTDVTNIDITKIKSVDDLKLYGIDKLIYTKDKTLTPEEVYTLMFDSLYKDITVVCESNNNTFITKFQLEKNGILYCIDTIKPLFCSI